MTPLRAPFPWFGGKSRVAHLVWERFGDTANFVEPFFGSGAVLLARPFPIRTETVNDKDAYLANFWRAVQADPEAVAAYADWPVSEPDLHARHRWLVSEGKARVEQLMSDPEYYDAKVAGWWVWGIYQWIGSGWCQVRHQKRPHLMNAGKGVHRSRPCLDNVARGLYGTAIQVPHLANAVLVQPAPGIGEDAPPVQLPHVSDAGRGGHRAPPTLPIACQVRDLASDGQGLSKKMPSLGDDGRGLHRPSSPRDWLCALSERLRRVRVCCGDWTRVMGPSVTIHNGLTGVFLDPPYSHAERDDDLYAVDENVAAAVREWAIANGDNPMLRIALCGYESEHAMPDSWTCIAWKAPGGYGSQGKSRARENAGRERIWFSPHCLQPNMQLSLLETAGAR